MANLSEDIQCAGSDTRPPMLDRTDFASWQQRIRLYCRGKENGVNILKSIDEGPFQMGTFRETLSEGNKGALHLGNMGQCEDAPGRMQLNSKFVNNMLPEWGRFVTAVKLNRGLRDSNYDQLYAYLKQHEAHANENKMMLDRFTQHTVDPLALMTNVAPQQYNSQSSTNPSSTYVPPHFADNSQLDSGLSPTDNLIENLTNTLALLTQSYKTYLPQTNNQLRTSSNPRNQATVQDGRVVVRNVQGQARQVKCYNCNGIGHIARNCTQPKRPQNSKYFKDNMLLMQAQENRVALDEEHEMHDDDNAVPVVQSNVSSIPNDAYMMIYNDMYEPYAQYVSKTTRNTAVDNSLTAELATYKEQVELYERRARKFEKELHSVKLQLASTINHNKSM
ncbi:integrase, catalytic region, zinc finger, CCHC-type containing protein, partial [Tanacetum coccineum]